MKTENRIAKAVGLLVLSLLFAGIFTAGQCHMESQDQACIGETMIQSQGICTLSADDQMSDTAISEQDLHSSSIISFLRHSTRLRVFENKICTESILAVLFKIAFIPCAVFLIFYFARNVDVLLKRIICDFLHWQDGKKRLGFSHI